MKKSLLIFLLGLVSAVLFSGCAPSDRIVVKNDFSSGRYYVRVPSPEIVTLELPFTNEDKFVYRIDSFNKEQGFFKVSMTGGSQAAGPGPSALFYFRGMPLNLLQKDKTFELPADASDSATVMYYLDWDAQFSFRNFELLRKGSVTAFNYDAENQLGLICLKGRDNYRECSAAKLIGGKLIYVFQANSKNVKDNLEGFVMQAMKGLKRSGS